MSAPSTALLQELKQLVPDSWHILATATSTALNHGHHWLPEIYKYAVKDFPIPEKSLPVPEKFDDDPLPRRKIVRQMKEVLTKSAILIGVPRCIEAGFALDPTILPQDQDETMIRNRFNLDQENTTRGEEGLKRVYQQNLDPIMKRYGNLNEFRWLSTNITYGVFLSACRPWQEYAPLTFPETEIIVLSCFVPQFARRELLWHLRGSLRSGLSHEEVEKIQQAISKVAIACGADPKQIEQLPRVTDVTEVDDLN